MDTAKQINIKNRTYYYKKSYKDINIYNIGSVTKKKIGNGMNINSFNPLYLGITRANGYIEEKDANNYSVFDSTDENKELLKKYNNFNGIRDKIREINNSECDYEKDYMKIKFSSDDDLPLNKSLKCRLMTITIRHVFEEDSELYLQVFVDDTLYEL